MSQMRKHISHFCKLPSLRQDVRKMWKSRSFWRVRVDLLEHGSPRQRVAVRKGKGGNGAGTAKTCWTSDETGHLSSQRPKKKVHAVEDLTTARTPPRLAQLEATPTLAAWVKESLSPGAQVRISFLLESQVCAKVSSLTSRSVQVLK